MSEKVTDISKFIKENFGANANYVEGLYDRYKSDPSLVDDSWRDYFDNMDVSGSGQISSTSANQTQEVVKPAQANVPADRSTNKKSKTATKSQPETKVREGVEAKALTGVAKVIVENMDESLTVPTATSVRRIPVKLLEENRKSLSMRALKTRFIGQSFIYTFNWLGDYQSCE